MCLGFHAAENFLCIFIFPLCGRHRQQGLKAVPFPCATTLLLGYAWKSLWIVVILPECPWYSSLQSDPRLTHKHWVSPSVMKNCSKYCWNQRNAVTCTVFSRIFNCEVLKTTVLLYSSTDEGLWRSQKVLSAQFCAVQQRLRRGKIPYRLLRGNSCLRGPFRNLENRVSSKFLVSFSFSAPQN